MSRTSSTLLLLALSTACGDDSDADSDAAETTQTPADTGGADDSSSAPAPITDGDSSGANADTTGAGVDPYACVETAFEIQVPFSGPGWDPETGVVDPLPQYVVSTTQALPFPDQVEAFGQLAGAAGMAAAQTPGLIALSFANEPNCGFARTLTVWRDEASMYAFVTGEAHAAAMAAASEVLVSGRTTHFTISADEMPYEWDAAIAELSVVEPF